MEIIYSAKRVEGIGAAKTRRFVNPSFFTTPEKGAKEVYLNGDFPKIAKSYKAVGITAKPLSDHPTRKPAPKTAD